jgi:myo-inositol-1-phosphate synthase
MAVERGKAGTLIAPSSYFMKTPPKQYKDEVAHAMTEAFIKGEG